MSEATSLPFPIKEPEETAIQIPLNDRSNGSLSGAVRTMHGRSRMIRGRLRESSSSIPTRRLSSLTSLTSLSSSHKRGKRGSGAGGAGGGSITVDATFAQTLKAPPVPETRKRPTLRKRKSDDLDAVDLDKIMIEHRSTVEGDDDDNDESLPVFSFRKSNAVGAFLPKVEPSREAHTASVAADKRPISSIFCPTTSDDGIRPARSIFEDMAFVAETFTCDFGGVTGRGSSTSATTTASASPPPVPVPVTPDTFRRTPGPSFPKSPALQPYIQEGESPCAVNSFFSRGCVSFWERSLAWSEDEEDDSDDSNNHSLRACKNRGHIRNKSNNSSSSSVVRDLLSVPKHLGKQYAPLESASVVTPTDAPNNRPKVRHSISRRSSRNSLNSNSRNRTLETDFRHRKGSKMFRQTEIDNVTEIHWDEQLVDLDSAALDLMAKLSL